MEQQILVAQLKQLLRSGYSIEDIRSLMTGPKVLVDQAILEYKQQSAANEKSLNPIRCQAQYAMRFGL